MAAGPADRVRAEQLGMFVNGHPERVGAVLPELQAMLMRNDEPTVLVTIVESLGLAYAEEASLSVLPLADHADPLVRLEVARAAPGGVESDLGVELAADTLIRLMDDSGDDVRDWATFGLGSVLSLDTPEVRSALVRRLDDPHFDTRCEAIVGLAARGDPRALAPTQEALRAGSVARLAVAAAKELGDPVLLPELEAIAAWWDVDAELLADALAACQPRASREH